MLSILKIGLLLLGSLLLQVTLIARISVFGSRFDLLLAFVVCIALFKGVYYGEVVGFISGLFYDIFSGGPLGTHTFSMIIIGYGVGFFRDRLYSDNPITQALCGFSATLVVKLFTSVYLGLFASPRFLSVRPLGLILAAIVNSLLVIAFYWMLKKFYVERST